MDIILLNKDLEEKYTEFVASENRSLFYHSLKYRDFLTGMLGCLSEYYLSMHDDQVTGILPVMKKDGKFGIVCNSLPFYGSNGGILASDQNSFGLLLAKYNEIVSADNVAASSLITNPLAENDYSGLKHDLTDERRSQFSNINFKKDISGSLMRSFHSKTRNMIRKAVKSEISVEIDNTQLEPLKYLHRKNMSAIGGRPKGDDFFRLLNEYFAAGDDYNIYVAKMRNEIIAVLLLFYHNNTAEYYMPVISETYKELQPLSLIIYQAMIDCAKEGYNLWDWGGTWFSQEGVYRFKKRWGSIDRNYRYYIKINNKQLYNSSTGELFEEYGNFYVIPYAALKKIPVSPNQ
ncbi:MAG: GNAT family N-acetyltransferase [Candidatus Omnitrophota bacterium]